MNVPILIVAPTGSGKSTSLKNLPPDRTVILNTERRPLPFRGFTKFKNINIGRYKEFKQVMGELKKSKDYDYVVIDSMTSLMEIVDKYARTVFSGYTIYSEYNAMIYDILQDIKELEQQVITTGVPEYFEGNDIPKAYLKTTGKIWKYTLEKEFSIVLHMRLLDDDEGNITDYQFDTKPSNHTSAKTPAGMIEERYIPNDVMLVIEAVNEYYQ